ncbi:MAG: amino acid ABC transporter substrate-binding protein [Treponema sp.]|nr:amino acid ABC transporter substrate-binding protein [Treponema sp.]
MKKIITILLAFSLIAVFTTGCKKEKLQNSLEKVISKNALVMGLDDSFPPMGFRNEANQIVGYDVDLAKEVASRLGVDLVLQPIDWSAKEQELNTGNIDCIWNGFTMTEERQAAMSFVGPYLLNSQVVIVRNDSGITTLADLAGKTISLQAGSSASEAVNSNSEFKSSLKKIVEFKDNLTAIMDLEARGVDAVVMDEVVAAYIIAKDNKPFVVLDEALAPESYGIGFRKSDVELTEAVKQTLEAMAQDGTIANISNNWFGKDISTIGK